MVREHLSVGMLLDTPITRKMTPSERVKANYTESCMVFRNFTSFDKGRGRELVAKFNNPKEAEMFIANYYAIFDYFEEQLKEKETLEAQLKAKDERIKELEDAMKSKTCEGCKTLPFVLTELSKKNDSKCGTCKRYVKDNYEAEPKDNA